MDGSSSGYDPEKPGMSDAPSSLTVEVGEDGRINARLSPHDDPTRSSVDPWFLRDQNL